MSSHELLYLSKADVASAGLGMGEIIAVLETAFREKGNGRTEVPPKPGIHPGTPDNFIHAMPAHIPALRSAGIKWVSGYPENSKRGLPYISGLLILNDVDTGLPLTVMDCVWITAMRTGAASALSARYLARPDSDVLGVLGCGVQGRTHVEAMREVFPLTGVRAYDALPSAAEAFAREITERFELPVTIVDHPREALRGSAIVVTAGPILKQPHQTIQPGWLAEGAFASLVDFDSYWHPAAMAESALFCTDDEQQLRYYQGAGFLQAIPPIHADLGELVCGRKTGRESTRERTMTANLGLALEDMAVAPLIYERAQAKGIGTRLAL